MILILIYKNLCNFPLFFLFSNHTLQLSPISRDHKLTWMLWPCIFHPKIIRNTCGKLNRHSSSLCFLNNFCFNNIIWQKTLIYFNIINIIISYMLFINHSCEIRAWGHTNIVFSKDFYFYEIIFNFLYSSIYNVSFSWNYIIKLIILFLFCFTFCFINHLILIYSLVIL